MPKVLETVKYIWQSCLHTTKHILSLLFIMLPHVLKCSKNVTRVVKNTKIVINFDCIVQCFLNPLSFVICAFR